MPFLQIHYKKVLMCIFLVSLCPGLVIARACSRVWQMLVSALRFSLQRLASIRRLTRVGYSIQWRNYNTNITWIFCPPRHEFAPRPLTWTWSRTEQPSSSYANTVVNWKTLCLQWRRFTRARQVKWPGWKIHRPGSALAPPCLLICFVSVWTENKNFTISDRWPLYLFYFGSVGGLCVL